MQIISQMMVNALTAFYQPFGFAMILSILFMFSYMFAKEKGWKVVVYQWIQTFITDKFFRRIFLLAFYTALVLFRTLLNRDLWKNALEDVIGIWGLYDKNGELTTEVLENLVLFIPFTVLLLWSFQERLIGQSVRFLETIWKSVKVVFLFSLTIETLQLILRLGTFQLSDLFYNTLGGLIGGLIYCIVYKIGHKIGHRKKKTE